MLQQIPAQAQRQVQHLSPQMIHTMTVLQMDLMELRTYITEAVTDNPVLDIDYQPENPESAVGQLDQESAYPADSEKNDWDPLARIGCYINEEGDLKRFLLSQFLGLDYPPEIMDGLYFLIGRLDESGYLDESIEELSELSGMPVSVLKRAMIELQAADPAGVGARDLVQCLRLQLERMSGQHLAIQIVEMCMDDLAHHRYSDIACKLGAGTEQVRKACQMIMSLNPRPGANFTTNGHLAYITPDVIVRQSGEELEVVINDNIIPHVKLNDYYLRLLQQSESAEVKAYLTERLNKANILIDCIAMRRENLRRCTELILSRQKLFFAEHSAYLRPFTMEEAAVLMDVHPSTVSRTVRNKYLQCRKGVFPMSYFFSRALSGESTMDVTPQRVKKLLQNLISEECKDKPLSDQKLCQQMEKLGILVARRTVAKYREELNIPSASGRKRK